MDINEDIFRLLLIILLLATDSGSDGLFQRINQVVIVALLLGSWRPERNDCRRDRERTDEERRFFV